MWTRDESSLNRYTLLEELLRDTNDEALLCATFQLWSPVVAFVAKNSFKRQDIADLTVWLQIPALQEHHSVPPDSALRNASGFRCMRKDNEGMISLGVFKRETGERVTMHVWSCARCNTYWRYWVQITVIWATRCANAWIAAQAIWWMAPW